MCSEIQKKRGRWYHKPSISRILTRNDLAELGMQGGKFVERKVYQKGLDAPSPVPANQLKQQGREH
jgi:hypothetical protein